MTQTTMPANIEAEQSLLGLLLWHTRTIPEVDILIDHTSFYKKDHNQIYRAMQTVDAKGDALDPVPIDAQLEQWGITKLNGLPSISYLYELQVREIERVSTDSLQQRAITYAQLIREAALRRRLIVFATNAQAIALNGSQEPYTDIVALLKEIEPYTKQDNNSRLVMGKKGKKVMKSDTLEDVLNYPDPEYLVAKILEIATVSLLYGESGTGKTFIALAIALAVALGQDWLGRRVKQGQVLYFYQEGKIGLKKRVRAWLKYYSIDSLPSNIQFITVPTHLIHDREYIFNCIEEHDELSVLVIVDTFSNCAPGVSQNNQEEVYPILAIGHEIAKSYGSHFMFIHHDNKGGDYNGSKAFRNHVDTMLLVEKGNVEGTIILCSKKSREEEPFTNISLQLHKVELDEISSSCIVVSSDANTSPALPQAQFQILEILHESGKLSSNEWHRKCEKAYKMPYTTWNRNRKKLEQAGLIEAPDSSGGTEKTYTVTQKGIELLTDTSITTTAINSYHGSSDTSHETTTTTSTTLRSGSSGSSGDTSEYVRSDDMEKVRYIV